MLPDYLYSSESSSERNNPISGKFNVPDDKVDILI